MPRLTKRLVDAAKPNAKGWTWVGDSEIPGFGLRVQPTGVKSYHLRYRNKSGRQRMIFLARHGEVTCEQARDLAREAMGKVRRGEDPADERRRERVGVRTVGELVDRWLDEYAAKHRKSHGDDRRRVRTKIKPALGRIDVEALQSSDLARWHEKLGATAKVEANRSLEALSQAWNWGRRHGRIPSELANPAVDVQRFKERSRAEYLKRHELERLLPKVDAQNDVMFSAFVRLILLTGCRKSEWLAASWADVDLENHELRIPKPKRGEPQVRVLPDAAVTILCELPRARGSEWVFWSPDDPRRHRGDYKRQWDRARDAAGLRQYTIHDLRRTCGSFLAQAGVPLEHIAAILGHSDVAVTRVYARLSKNEERTALEALSASLAGVLGLSNGRPPQNRDGTDLILPKDDLRHRLEALLRDGDGVDLANRLRVLAGELDAGSPTP